MSYRFSEASEIVWTNIFSCDIHSSWFNVYSKSQYGTQGQTQFCGCLLVLLLGLIWRIHFYCWVLKPWEMFEVVFLYLFCFFIRWFCSCWFAFLHKYDVCFWWALVSVDCTCYKSSYMKWQNADAFTCLLFLNAAPHLSSLIVFSVCDWNFIIKFHSHLLDVDYIQQILMLYMYIYRSVYILYIFSS